MRKAVYRILALNPGSTSTKLGVFDNEKCLIEAVIRHDKAYLSSLNMPNGSVLTQKAMRKELIFKTLEEKNIVPETLDAVVGRAGRLPPMPSGTYLANDAMLKDVPDPLVHPALLGAIIAREMGKQLNIPSYFVDPTVVDEITPLARLTGIPEIKRSVIFHALNHKAVARKCAKELRRAYKDCNFIVAHLGGGISIAAHEHGKAIDVTNASNGEGPYSPERAGAMPALPLVDLCFSGKYTKAEIKTFFTKKGGLSAYTGSSDFKLLESNYSKGDAKAILLLEGMAYRIAKDIGAMYAVLSGNVDCIIITGGLAYSHRLIALITARVEKLAPVVIYPGEDELLALAQGALRALTGEEPAIVYRSKTENSQE